jgi:hypothetical protein
MEITCSNPDCTVAQTGKCLLNNEVESCPHRTALAASGETAGLPPVLDAPVANVRLAASLTLDRDAAAAIASSRACTQVGILGFPDSGKTAAIVSLYLLLAKGLLRGFEFRDSRTLMALEKTSRGARKWNVTALPEQVTAHTESADGRTAGYLHLRVYAHSCGRCLDLLLPDLPGEWTTSLVDRNRTDRLNLLRSAKVIWLFADGRQLLKHEQRHHALHRLELVLRRLAAFLGEQSPSITLVVTHKDRGSPDGASIAALESTAAQLGLRMSTLQIASFTIDEKVAAAGEGLAELLEGLCSPMGPRVSAWADSPRRPGSRGVLSFRGEQR